MPLSIQQFRASVGKHHNNTRTPFSDNSKQQHLLNTLALAPGDPVKRAKAELLLQSLLIISNVMQNNISSTIKKPDHDSIRLSVLANSSSAAPSAPGGSATGSGDRSTPAGHLPLRVTNRAAAGVRKSVITHDIAPKRRRRSLDRAAINRATASPASHPANPAAVTPASHPANPAAVTPASHPANPAAVTPARHPANPAAVTPASHPANPAAFPAPTFPYNSTAVSTVISQLNPANLSATAPPPERVSLAASSLTPAPFLEEIYRYELSNDSAYRIQIQHISQFLLKKDLLIREDENNASPIINAAIDYLHNAKDGAAKLAQQLLKHSGNYGAKKNETLSPDMQYRLFNRWLENELFKPSLDVFIAQEMRLIIADKDYSSKPGQDKLTARLYQAVLRRIGEGEGGYGLSAAAKTYIMDEVVLCSIPALRFHGEASPDDGIEPGDIDWGFLHAGLRFADSIGLDSEALSKEEATELGQALGDMLGDNMLSPRFVHFFSLSAGLFYLKTHLKEETSFALENLFGTGDMSQQALTAFFAANEQRIIDAHPVNRLSRALANFKPRLALLAQGGAAEADRLFNEQNVGIANLFAIMDGLLMGQAITDLPSEESAFLAGAAVTRISAEFSAFDTVKNQMVISVLPRNAYIVGLAPDVDLLAARRGDETRIFAMQQTADGYQIIRVDRQQMLYYALMSEPGKCRGDSAYKLEIYSEAVNAPVLKHALADNDALVKSLVEWHRADLISHLHTLGYTETTLEKTQRYLLSLIPFYDCITGIINKQSESVVPCMMDVLSLIPAAGHAANLSARMAQKGMMGGISAYHKTLTTMAVRSAIKAFTQKSSQYILGQAASAGATELSKTAFVRLGLSAIRSLDPGLELGAYVSFQSLRKIVELARVLGMRIPLWKRLLPELEARLARQAGTPSPYEFRYARLTGMGHGIPVVKLGGDRLHGQDIFVRILPETGEVFGRKYTLSADNRLTAVPLPLSQRLNNILTEGLGGRGGPRVARRLAARAMPYERIEGQLEGQPYTMAMANHLVRWIDNLQHPDPLDMKLFTSKYGLDGSRWRFYVDQDGMLTASGQQLLEHTGITSWSRLFELPPELQDSIICYLDRTSLKNMIRAFPAMDNEHPRLNSLRTLAQLRLDGLRRSRFDAWTAWADQGAATEMRGKALTILKNNYDGEHMILDLRGFQLVELPAKLPRALKELNISGNLLTALPTDLPEGLIKLDASANLLETLPETLPDSLQFLIVKHNRLGLLSERLPTSLIELNAANNFLLNLPRNLPERLEKLSINGNMIANLPERLPGNLKYLYAGLNRLVSMPDRLPLFTSYLDVSDNFLSRLPEHLPPHIVHLHADNNRLEALPTELPKKLRQLKVTGNLLTELPERLPGTLTHIYASNNVLIRLPNDLPARLKYLSVHRNLLTSLPSKLSNSMHTLGLGHNFLTSLDIPLPEKLVQLVLRGNNGLALPSAFPPTLKMLDVRECGVASKPDNLPEGVKFYYLGEGAPPMP